jgi:hypothetical protein
MENKPASMLLHIGASVTGVVAVVSAGWWLNKNPLDLPRPAIMGLVIICIFIISVMLNISSIVHSHLEKNYNYHPLAGVVFE